MKKINIFSILVSSKSSHNFIKTENEELKWLLIISDEINSIVKILHKISILWDKFTFICMLHSLTLAVK